MSNYPVSSDKKLTKQSLIETTSEYVIDDIDQLTSMSSQLSAMLMMVSGEGFKTFDIYNNTIKQNYLWACSDLANKIDGLSSKMAGVK